MSSKWPIISQYFLFHLFAFYYLDTSISLTETHDGTRREFKDDLVQLPHFINEKTEVR